MPRENVFVNAFPEGKQRVAQGQIVSAQQPQPRQDGIRLNLRQTRRTIASLPPAAPGTMAAVQEQKQINDLVEELELSVCIIRDPCIRRIALPHGDAGQRCAR
jgi:hypothetical protein